ncbi:type II toxin-antitoxin system VapC family toxin [Longimicrobium sp.]|uniref:type II toxin-antitoxin system VapC family toxin n=1 Tax=Longimicrobium sp. TaxID=2029185 RepID=UPI003B3B2B0D
MPKPRVYVETTIPSFYYETRTQPNLVAWRDLTREWWSDAAERYELVTSFTVFKELSRGRPAELVRLRMELLSGIPLLLSQPKISEIVQSYLRHKLMPSKPVPADATHLALASHHDCDFIVTWNCRHPANPNKASHIRRINSALGLHVPELVTPEDLLRRR